MQKVKVDKLATFTGHRDCVYTLEKAVQPHLFFSAAGDGMVVCWNLQAPDQGELIANIPASVYAMHCIPTANQLWIGQNFEGVHVIDLHTKKEIRSVKVTAAAIFDIQSWQQHVFIATGDGMVTILDRETFAVRKHIKAADKSARCIAINPQTQEFAVGYSDHYIRVYDLNDFNLKFTIAAHTNSVFTLCYSPDYTFLLSGSRDAHLKAWDVTQDYRLHESVIAHMFAINHIVFSPDGRHFLTCSMDKSVKVWDAATYRLLKVIDRARYAGHGTSINKMIWSDFHAQAVSCSDDRTISVWQLHFSEVPPADI